MVALTSIAVGLVAILLQTWTVTVRAAAETTLNITALTNEVKSDWTAVYYSEKKPLLIANDGGAENGGLHVYAFDNQSPLPVVKSLPFGRTKTLTVMSNVGGKDLVAAIAAPDSIIRVFELPDMKKARAEFTLLGDWSAMCAWKSKSLNQYFYVFGKAKAVQLLIRPKGKDFEVIEIQTMELPFEPTGCAVSESENLMFLHGDETTDLHVFPLEESTIQPQLSIAGEVLHDLTGIAIYHAAPEGEDFLFTAQKDTIVVYEASSDIDGSLRGTIKLSGAEGIEVSGLSLLQSSTKGFRKGALAFAVETDDLEAYGVVSLENVFEDLDIPPNTKYQPGSRQGDAERSTICKACNNNGYCINSKNKASKQRCECFAAFAGPTCSDFTCTNNCSNNGYCIGPDMCKCNQGWGGLHCSFLLVEPTYETEANGGDGDDPAIWIANERPDEMSRVITTVKSERGAGLGVYDLQGKLVQHLEAPQPNNVDIIYGFDMGDRKADLAFAACREDNTLCLFEILSNGTLTAIPGGSSPTPEGYKVYGSCVYRSRKTNKQYLFVNEKSAKYLQYELTAEDGRLKSTLVREFQGGNGGQVEGCVADDENGWLFLGEEPSALWRYDAEPDSSAEDRVLVAKVGDGKLFGDVEGVTLVNGHAADQGFVIVSCQGASAYNVYRRAAPHEYIATFTITDSRDGKIDKVTNTDGIAAVGRKLGPDFPYGLVVVHDDTNQLPDGTTSEDASFKMVSLERILGADAVKSLRLLKEVDTAWDPRR